MSAASDGASLNYVMCNVHTDVLLWRPLLVNSLWYFRIKPDLPLLLEICSSTYVFFSKYKVTYALIEIHKSVMSYPELLHLICSYHTYELC